MFSGQLAVRPAEQTGPRQLCKKETKDGKLHACCKNCQVCKTATSKCENGTGKCKCGAKACAKKRESYYKSWHAEHKVCHKTEKVCKKVEKTYTAKCRTCKRAPHKVKYQCGTKCHDAHEVTIPAQTAPCKVPGKCTTTVTHRTVCHRDTYDCKTEKFPKPPQTARQVIKNCVLKPEKKRVCTDIKVPKKTCVTVVQPAEQHCKTKGEKTCKKVLDGQTKKCSIEKTKTKSCSLVQKKVPHNCRKVQKYRQGKCSTTYKTKQECSRGGVPMVCRDILKTKNKCKLVRGYKNVCPKKEKKVCHSEKVRVKIPGSCKTKIVPCVGYHVRQAVSGRSVPVDGTYGDYKECQKKAIVCQYKYKKVKKCHLRQIPVRGKPCSRVPTYYKKCTPIKSKSRVCFRQDTTAPTTDTPSVVQVDGPAKCYKNGVRCAGANGHPAIDHQPCCENNSSCEPKEGDWGKFCTKKKTDDKLDTAVRAYDNVTCKNVKYPETKCEKEQYSEVQCDHRYVKENVCVKGTEPKLHCTNVPKYREECTGPGKSYCEEDLKKETKCTLSYYKKQFCKKVPVDTAHCKAKQVTTCKTQGYYSKKVCYPRKDYKPKCETKRHQSTKCAKPTNGVCKTAPKKVKVVHKKCEKKFCEKTLYKNKCTEKDCQRTRPVEECVDKKVETPCKAPPFKCELPKQCKVTRIRCRTDTCSPATCHAVTHY